MTATPVPRAFDTIAPSYDETRDPLEPAVVDAVAARLEAAGVRDLLEVGVGTGRVAVPLTRAGLRLTGLDASSQMLARAHGKGLPRLVRGSAYHLPFGSGTLDGALFVHVLHLLDEPVAALREAARVTRRGAFALVRPGPSGSGESEPDRESPRRLVYRLLAERGYPVAVGAEQGPPHRERALLDRLPPDELDSVCDRMVTEPVAKRFDSLHASRHTLHVPRDELERAIAQARAEVGDRTVTFRKREALAHWSKATLSAGGVAPGP